MPMSAARPSTHVGQCVHLALRGRGNIVLVQDMEDWLAFSAMARRMIFWCGGAIHGCRCEAGEIHLAVTVGRAPLSCMVRHLSSAYAKHVRGRRSVTRSVFRHYSVNRIDADLHLDHLVIWLHRRWERPSSHTAVWTAEDAYLKPNSSDWITTGAVLEALGGASGLTYRRRTLQALSPDDIAALSRDALLDSSCSTACRIADGLSADDVARLVAKRLHISYEHLCSGLRTRALSRAKVVTAVLCARRGIAAAEVARLFKRSRSTLGEQVEHYRQTQPYIFDDAERLLDDWPAEKSRDNVLPAGHKRFVVASLPAARLTRP
jgi:hypothetical protein